MKSTDTSWIKKHSLTSFFILAYAVTWCIEIPLALSAQGLISAQIPMTLHYLGAFGPMVAALIVLALTEGRTGIKKLLSRWFKWRVGVRYYVFAILGPITFFMLAVLINRIVTGAWSDFTQLGEADYLPYVGPLGALLVWLLTYGLGEETGWRGYALPHLQRKHSAANSTLILAILWAFWHLPAFFYRDTYIQMGFLGFPVFLVSIIFATMVFTWLYNSTAGSLLLVILFHAFFNWLTVSEAGGAFTGIIMSVPVILWAIFVVRRYGPEDAAPIKRQVA
ncbi:MAG: CPBP family intramembrane glutamic endopeptidase [Anaerolineales bacterium]